MEKVIIRDAVPQDAEALAELNKNEMGYEFPPERTREKLLSLTGDKILVAEAAGKVVGYVHLNGYDTLYMEHLKNIMGIAVDSHFRRMGIGRRLLLAAEEWARESGAAGVRLVSGESRTGAHAFYRSLGYVGDKKQVNLRKMF